jgi:hypothetical protein
MLGCEAQAGRRQATSPWRSSVSLELIGRPAFDLVATSGIAPVESFFFDKRPAPPTSQDTWRPMVFSYGSSMAFALNFSLFFICL